MKIIVSVILLLYGLVMLLMCYIAIFPKEKKSKNNVRFYVEMGKNDKELKLYIQIIRGYKIMISGASEFKWFGLNPNDFADMKEGDIKEVFLNMED